MDILGITFLHDNNNNNINCYCHEQTDSAAVLHDVAHHNIVTSFDSVLQALVLDFPLDCCLSFFLSPVTSN